MLSSETRRYKIPVRTVHNLRIAARPVSTSPQEASGNRIKVARRFPERRMTRPGQAVAAPFRQIGVGDSIDESFDVVLGQVLPARHSCGEAMMPCAMLSRPTG